MPVQLGGPFPVDRGNVSGGSAKHAAAAVQADNRRAASLAGGTIEVSVQLGRAVERREMHGLLRPASRSPEKQHDDGGDDDAHPNLPAKISNVYRRPSENVPPLRISRRKG